MGHQARESRGVITHIGPAVSAAGISPSGDKKGGKTMIKITRLRRMRWALGLSMAALSRQVQVNANFMSAVERGQTVASGNFRIAMARFYNVHSDYLFDNEGFALDEFGAPLRGNVRKDDDDE